MSEQGSITGIFAVLVEADDANEPISDAVRGVLDGHIVLSRKLAQRNQYPAVDVLASISRLTPYIVSEKHLSAIDSMKQALAYYYDAEDLIQIGAYVHGSDEKIDWALSKIEGVNGFLKQGIEEGFDFDRITESLCSIFNDDGEG
jgi:flagellum-specific ATP synthase